MVSTARVVVEILLVTKMKKKNEKIEEEQLKMRYLRFIVDLTEAQLYDENQSILESIQLMRSTKRLVLNLFPGKEFTYDLIYKPRFHRILKERLNSN